MPSSTPTPTLILTPSLAPICTPTLIRTLTVSRPTSGHSSAFDSPVEGYDTRRYAIDWLNYFASLTLLRSLDEAKPLFDAEMHLSSATRWRRNVVDDTAARGVRLD